MKYWPCTRDGRILVFPTAHKTEPEEAVFHIQLGFVFSDIMLLHTDFVFSDIMLLHTKV